MSFGMDDGDDIRLKGGTDATIIGNVLDYLKSVDFVNTAAVNSSLTVGTSAVLLKVGGAALANRRYVTIQPKDVGVFWGYSASVTTAAGANAGTEIFKDQYIVLPIGPGITVYLIATGAGKDVRIGELS